MLGLFVSKTSYSGEYYSIADGTYYLRNRIYQPTTGRFLTEDPIQDGLNYYTYCSNNPVYYNDPSGLSISLATELAISMALAVTSVVAKENIESVVNPPKPPLKNSSTFSMEMGWAMGWATYSVIAAYKSTQIYYPFEVSYGSYYNTNTVKYMSGYALPLPKTLNLPNLYPRWTTPWILAPQMSKQSKSSGKDKSNDRPEWSKWYPKNQGESANDYADRLLNDKYGKGNYDKGPNSEHNKIRKWADRGGKYTIMINKNGDIKYYYDGIDIDYSV